MVSTHLCILVQPCIIILFVPHIGWGGADNICWDPQCGGISWMLNDHNRMDIFASIVALSIYLPDFDCFNHIAMIDLLNCVYVKII